LEFSYFGISWNFECIIEGMNFTILIFKEKKFILIEVLFKYRMIHYNFMELLEEKKQKSNINDL
jgi:hypothetical protein